MFIYASNCHKSLLLGKYITKCKTMGGENNFPMSETLENYIFC
jgi:hypothetical protein